MVDLPRAAIRGPAGLADVVRALDHAQLEVEDIGLRRPTLDEVFLALTGAPIDDGNSAGDEHDRPDQHAA